MPPAKVQSALLEAMQERQVTIGDDSHALDDPFMVLATQNPIEQEGTYPLPEAQVDRFMLKVQVSYPNRDEELRILRQMARTTAVPEVEPILQPADFSRLRALVEQIHMEEKVEEYVVDVVYATREPAGFGLELDGLIEYGASPRATIYLTLAAKAHALLRGRGYVTPQDVKTMAPDVLRHRVILSYEAEAEERNRRRPGGRDSGRYPGAVISPELARQIRYIQISAPACRRQRLRRRVCKRVPRSGHRVPGGARLPLGRRDSQHRPGT